PYKLLLYLGNGCPIGRDPNFQLKRSSLDDLKLMNAWCYATKVLEHVHEELAVIPTAARRLDVIVSTPKHFLDHRKGPPARACASDDSVVSHPVAYQRHGEIGQIRNEYGSPFARSDRVAVRVHNLDDLVRRKQMKRADRAFIGDRADFPTSIFILHRRPERSTNPITLGRRQHLGRRYYTYDRIRWLELMVQNVPGQVV